MKKKKKSCDTFKQWKKTETVTQTINGREMKEE